MLLITIPNPLNFSEINVDFKIQCQNYTWQRSPCENEGSFTLRLVMTILGEHWDRRIWNSGQHGLLNKVEDSINYIETLGQKMFRHCWLVILFGIGF